MPPRALALVLVAAVAHATWNALAKRGRDPFLFLWSSLGLSAALLAPVVAVAHADALAAADAWPYVAATVAIHAAYLWTLATAYRHGDFSRVYPIARGLSVALVGGAAWAVLGERPSPLGVAGIALVVVGIALVGTYRAAGPIRAGTGTTWALATGVLIAAYSVVDKAGVQRMHPIPYVFLLGAGMVAALAPVAIRRRDALRAEWRANARRIVAAACVNLLGYLLVLYAFRLASAGYVVAARELSIVLSVVIGWRWFGERPLAPRLARAALIVAGVACVALSR